MEGLITVRVNLREGKGRVCCSGRSGFNPFWCWTDSPVQTEAGGSLRCSLEAHGWISRLQTDTECWFTEGGGGGGKKWLYLQSVSVCSAVQGFQTEHLPAHVKEGTQLPKWGGKKKNQALQLEVIMSQTHEHLLIPFYLWEKLLHLLLYAYFQLLEWTSGLRNTASAFACTVSSQIRQPDGGCQEVTLTRPLVFLWAFKSVLHGQF